MFKEDNFGRFFSFWLSLILYNFIVLGKLYLIGLDHLGNFRFVWFFETWEHLDEIDRHRKHTFWGLDYLFEFLGVISKLAI